MSIEENTMKKKDGMMIEEDRYARQKLLWGDDGQARLEQARVAVVGLDHQGVYAALCMTSLGVGNIVLIDGSNVKRGEMFLDMSVPKGAKAEQYPQLMQKINKQVTIEGYTTNLESRIDQLTLEGADVIIDATNDAASKRWAIQYGKENDIPVLSTSSRSGYTKLMTVNGVQDPAFLMPMFEGHQQSALMALIMAGVITEEVRKAIFGEPLVEDPVRYKLGEGYRFGFPQNENTTLIGEKGLKNFSAAMLGGGGLGCWGAVAGTLMKFGRLDMYDYDTFESHNVNRQILAYDGIDKLKAEHVADKIEKMSKGKTKSTGYNLLILPGFDTDIKYDVVFDFVDNSYTRAINAAYAIKKGIPSISAGALPYSARWDIHQEGKTQCMDCMFNIYEEGRKEEMIRRASCAANPDPSVVMSNAIGAVAAMLDAYTVLRPDVFGEPFNGEQVYRSTGQKRFGTSPLVDICDCYHHNIPDLEISDEDVAAFVEANPHLLQEEVQEA